jgi:hypothetical protein
MQGPYGEAVATRTDLEPWRCGGDAVTQASAEDCAGWVWSRVITESGASRPFPLAEDITGASLSQDASGPRAVVDPMHVRRLSGQELGDPALGRDGDGVAVRVVNPAGARRR